MGGLIVERAAWDRVPLNPAFIGTCWAHAARLFQLMEDGLTVRYMARALLDRRGENNSFLIGAWSRATEYRWKASTTLSILFSGRTVRRLTRFGVPFEATSTAAWSLFSKRAVQRCRPSRIRHFWIGSCGQDIRTSP